VEWRLLLYRDSSRLSNVKILITLPHGVGCVWTEEFVAEDLGEDDIVGLVFGFELVATDRRPAEVARFPPGSFRGAEGGRHVLGELRAGGGVNGLGGRETL
jgi:hypothetical protein